MVKLRLLFVCVLLLGALDAKSPALLEMEKLYYSKYLEPSDINEHLPHLRRLASECSSVTEIGIRDVVSTWAVLLGLSESGAEERSYVGIDLNAPPLGALIAAHRLAEENGVSFKFVQGNDMKVDIEPTDLLFIDTVHTYCHLTYELEKFAPKVNQYIALHDTDEPWGFVDDACYYGDYSEYPVHIDRNKKGLWQAVVDFLKTHPEWTLYERHLNNHGFTVLKRNAEPEVSSAQIDDAIKNRMILCTGPSLGRREWLKKHTEADLLSIPFKKIFLATNDSRNMNITFDDRAPTCRLIKERGHQLDCLNCILSSIKAAANDPECSNDDIILFKHESLFINDMVLVRQAVKKILEGEEMVARFWAPDSFYMTNAFYITVDAARKVFRALGEVTAFGAEYGFCEDYFTKRIVSSLSRIYRIDYSHRTRKDTELGLYHIPPQGEENEDGYWDKRNYNDLY